MAFTLPPSITKLIRHSQSSSTTRVLVTGVFDLLHSEHINFLIQARQTGDLLFVGIESDSRVHQLKGPHRPIHAASTRLRHLKDTGLVDAAFVLPSQFSRPKQHHHLLSLIKPHLLAVSSHSPHLDQKRRLIQEINGQVRVVYPHHPALSTTRLLSQPQLASPLSLHPVFSSTTTPAASRSLHLGFPTLNLVIPKHFPYRHGVYAGLSQINHHWLPTAFHYGPIPTFSSPSPALKAHLIEYHLTHPPSRLSFRFLFRLRSCLRFSSPNQLISQITQDIDHLSRRLQTLNAKITKDE